MSDLGVAMANIGQQIRGETIQALFDLFPVANMPIAIAGVVAVVGGVLAVIFKRL